MRWVPSAILYIKTEIFFIPLTFSSPLSLSLSILFVFICVELTVFVLWSASAKTWAKNVEINQIVTPHSNI